MRRAGVTVAILSRAEDVCYATGFELPPPIDARAAFAYAPPLALVCVDGTRALVVPDAYPAAARSSEAETIVLVPVLGQFEPVDARHELLRGLEHTINQLGLSAGAAAAIDAASLPIELHENLSRLLATASFADVRPLVGRARMIKSADEIALLRDAAAAADAGQEALLAHASPGKTEIELMSEVLTAVDAIAGHPLPWAGELVTGPRVGSPSYPGGPTDREIVTGDTVLMDLSVRRRGYWADCTNTLVVASEPTPDQRRYFTAAREAYDSAADVLRPGRRASEAHDAAARTLRAHGFEPAHYTGHQIGAGVNELPRLVPYDRTVVEPGMVFAVEPGCYGADAGTGARAERVVLVTETDPEPLTRFAWGIEC
jgi:Xaa-Pro dipeptidase